MILTHRKSSTEKSSQQYCKPCLYSIKTCLLWHQRDTTVIHLRKGHTRTRTHARTHTVPGVQKYNSLIAMMKSFGILVQNPLCPSKNWAFSTSATKRKQRTSLVLNVIFTMADLLQQYFKTTGLYIVWYGPYIWDLKKNLHASSEEKYYAPWPV